MDKKLKLKEALNRFAKLDYSHTPEIRYERINELIACLEELSKDIALTIFQKVVDVIKAKEAVEAAQKEIKTETTNVETEVKEDGKQS